MITRSLEKFLTFFREKRGEGSGMDVRQIGSGRQRKLRATREREGKLRERERAVELRKDPSLLLHIHPVALKKSCPFNFFIVKSDECG